MDLKLILLFICLMIIQFTSAVSWKSIERLCTYESDENIETTFYDVRSLSLKSGYLTIKNNADTFFINICSQKNEFKTTDNLNVCSPTTSICLVNDQYPKGLDLGGVHYTELSINNNTLAITFSKENNDKNSTCKIINSEINLICSKTRALENKPEFKDYKLNTDDHSCKYTFEWKTTEGCPDSHTVIEPHYKDKPLVFLIGNQTIDFDQFFKPQKLIGKHSENEFYDYIIKHKEYMSSTNSSANRYNNTSSAVCDDSYVCQLKQDRSFVRPIGKLANTTLKHANESFHLILSSDSKCGRASNRNASVIFNLFCDDTLNLNQSNVVFKAENNVCYYIFDVFSKKICEYEKLFEQNEQLNSKNITDKATTTIPRSTNKPTDTKAETQHPKDTTKQPDDKKIGDSKASTAAVQNQNESNSNTTLFGFIILLIVSVVGIVLAVFSLINDDRRTWLQKKVRRVIRPQNTTFTYSQLSTNNMHLINNNQQFENFNSSYAPTVLPKSNTNQFNETNKQINNQRYNLRGDSFNVKTSIREQIDRLSFMNDNDLGVSRNNYTSFSRKPSKDESELDLLT